MAQPSHTSPNPHPHPPNLKRPGGRYLDDFWIYDLGTLQWSQAQATVAQQQPNGTADEAEPEGGEEAAAPLLSGAALPPSAGHSVTTWGERLLVLGGHTKVGGSKGRFRDGGWVGGLGVMGRGVIRGQAGCCAAAVQRHAAAIRRALGLRPGGRLLVLGGGHTKVGGSRALITQH